MIGKQTAKNLPRSNCLPMQGLQRHDAVFFALFDCCKMEAEAKRTVALGQDRMMGECNQHAE